MNTFAFFVLCAQACLVQNVYSQCLGGPSIAPAYAPFGRTAYAVEAPLVAPAAVYPTAAGFAGAYGGEGVGDVAVAGEMGVAGTTLVAGQVPILGAVRFGGDLPAAGAVTITGTCGCGCSPYGY